MGETRHAELVLDLAEPPRGEILGVDGALGGFALEDALLARAAGVFGEEVGAVGGDLEPGFLLAPHDPIAFALGEDFAAGGVLP